MILRDYRLRVYSDLAFVPNQEPISLDMEQNELDKIGKKSWLASISKKKQSSQKSECPLSLA